MANVALEAEQIDGSRLHYRFKFATAIVVGDIYEISFPNLPPGLFTKLVEKAGDYLITEYCLVQNVFRISNPIDPVDPLNAFASAFSVTENGELLFTGDAAAVQEPLLIDFLASSIR